MGDYVPIPRDLGDTSDSEDVPPVMVQGFPPVQGLALVAIVAGFPPAIEYGHPRIDIEVEGDGSKVKGCPSVPRFPVCRFPYGVPEEFQ